MTRCPKCAAELETDVETCPHCASVSSTEVRRLQNAEYLARDSWSSLDAGRKNQSERVREETPSAEAQAAGAVAAEVARAERSTDREPALEPSARSLFALLLSNPLDSAAAFAARLGACALGLVVLWCVPEVIGVSLIFPWHLARTTHGVHLIALLAGPMAAVLIISALISTLHVRKKAACGLFISLMALGVPLVFDSQALVLDGRVALVVAGAAMAVSLAVAFMLESWRIGHLALALFPAALLATVLWGAAASRHPWRHLTAFKDPIEIYAAMLAATLCAAYLYKTRK